MRGAYRNVSPTVPGHQLKQNKSCSYFTYIHVINKEETTTPRFPSAGEASFPSKRRFTVCHDRGESRATGSGRDDHLARAHPAPSTQASHGSAGHAMHAPWAGHQGGCGVSLRELGDISQLGPRTFPPLSRVILVFSRHVFGPFDKSCNAFDIILK